VDGKIGYKATSWEGRTRLERKQIFDLACSVWWCLYFLCQIRGRAAKRTSLVSVLLQVGQEPNILSVWTVYWHLTYQSMKLLKAAAVSKSIYTEYNLRE